MPTATDHSTAPSDHRAPTGDVRRWLSTYLRDHRGGATFGTGLARRSQQANAGTDLGRTLAVVAREIEEDSRTLDTLMSQLGIRPSRTKMALAKGADLLARTKLHGRLRPFTPESRVLQLETLTAGILTKRHLWQALAAVSDQLSTLDRPELEHLVRRADAQLARLDAHHAPASRVAFGDTDEQL
jgi:hypothetical protein